MKAIANQILSVPLFSRPAAAFLEAAGRTHLARRVALKGGGRPPEIIEETLPSWLGSRVLRMQSCDGRDQVARVVWGRGWDCFERPLPFLFARLAQRSRTVLDVGANTGFYSLLAGHAGATVLAFEPIPSIANILEGNLRNNGLLNVHVFRCAVSNVSGRVRMFLPKADHGLIETGASLNPEFQSDHSAEIDVEVCTVDQVSEDHQIDLIKIDVESLEEKVLNGAQRTIARCRPIISVEILSDNSVLARWGSEIDYKLVTYGSNSHNQLLCPLERLGELPIPA
jgi:FkbM family methyltransferase